MNIVQLLVFLCLSVVSISNQSFINRTSSAQHNTLQTVYWTAEVRCALAGREIVLFPQRFYNLLYTSEQKTTTVFCRLQKPSQHTTNNSHRTQSKPRKFSSKYLVWFANKYNAICARRIFSITSAAVCVFCFFLPNGMLVQIQYLLIESAEKKWRFGRNGNYIINYETNEIEAINWLR